MNAERFPRGFFWVLTVIGVMNFFLILVRMVRQTDPYVLLTLVSPLLAVIIAWLCLARLRNGLGKLGDIADRQILGRLEMMAQTLYLMGNLGILSLLTFVPMRVFH